MSLEFGKKPTPTETWDPQTNTLRIETTHSLSNHLHEITIAINAGDINVTTVDEEVSTVTSRLIISANSKEAARKFLPKEKDLQVENKRRSFTLNGSNEQTFTIDPEGMHAIIHKGKAIRGQGHNLISAEAGDTVSLGPGYPMNLASEALFFHGGPVKNVMINGEPLKEGDPNILQMPNMRREVDIFVSKSAGEISYDLKTYIGDISFHDGEGRGEIAAILSGEVDVKKFTGNLRIENVNGKTTVADSEGNLAIKGGKKDIIVDTFNGTVDLVTKEGNILVKEVSFKGTNEFDTTTGAIEITTVNDILNFYAETKGDIKLPDKVTIVDEKVPTIEIKNKDSDTINRAPREVEGYLGNVRSENDEIEIASKSGNITLITSNEIH